MELDSVDSLFDMFEDLTRLMEAGKANSNEEEEEEEDNVCMTKDSLFGVFVRQSLLAFRKLSFDQTIQLFKQLQLFVAPIAEGENGRFYSSLVDSQSAKITFGDAERFLDIQLDLLTSGGGQTCQTSPLELKQKLNEIWQQQQQLSKVHFLTCLNACRSGDQQLAIDSLHRYFDYALSNNNSSVLFYPYALLYLGIIHFKFQNIPEALTALKESIDLSRHSKDLICLKYALSWQRHIQTLSNNNPTNLNPNLNTLTSHSSVHSDLIVLDKLATIRAELESVNRHSDPNRRLEIIKEEFREIDRLTSNNSQATNLHLIQIAKFNFCFLGIGRTICKSLVDTFESETFSSSETFDIFLCQKALLVRQ